jgi:hypothetical protein
MAPCDFVDALVLEPQGRCAEFDQDVAGRGVRFAQLIRLVAGRSPNVDCIVVVGHACPIFKGV